jgi:hypothetical protein
MSIVHLQVFAYDYIAGTSKDASINEMICGIQASNRDWEDIIYDPVVGYIPRQMIINYEISSKPGKEIMSGRKVTCPNCIKILKENGF